MGSRNGPPRSHDDEPGEIEYGDFPDASDDLWIDDDEDVIELEDLDDDAGVLGLEAPAVEPEAVEVAAADEPAAPDADDALREELFAAIADLADEADETPEPATPAPEPVRAETPPEPQPLIQPEAAAPPVVPAPPVVEVRPTPPSAPPAPAPVVHVEVPAAPGREEEASDEGAPVLPDWIYRIVLTLPLDLVEQIEELREDAGIEGAPPPGIDLAPVFRTDDPVEVEGALDDWAQEHLPFDLEVAGVLASVIGTQQYVAGLAVEPEDALDEPYDDLMFNLDGLIVPAEDDDVQLAQIVVGSAVPALTYPRLVARMQREIDLIGWRAESVMLIRREAGADLADWQVVALFA
jgi:hypothetical protein